MATLERLKAGQIVFQATRQYTMTLGYSVYPIEIVEVDLVERRVLAKWNRNPATWFSENEARYWRIKEPHRYYDHSSIMARRQALANPKSDLT